MKCQVNQKLPKTVITVRVVCFVPRDNQTKK